MAQRNSDYERRDFDLYETPAWVTRCVLPVLKRIAPPESHVLEPACGSGKMLEVLAEYFPEAMGTDIAQGYNFLELNKCELSPTTRRRVADGRMRVGIVTNPPYSVADEFVRHALKVMVPVSGFVAMLLRVDFDSAKTRRDVFADHPAFAAKVVLLERIKWFDPPPGEKGKSPSENHAWYIWDYARVIEPPSMLYEPMAPLKLTPPPPGTGAKRRKAVDA